MYVAIGLEKSCRRWAMKWHILPGNSYWTQDILPSSIIDEAATAVKRDIDLLLALNSKVAPRDQVPLLLDIHGQLQRFLAPYLLYHRV